ncbi:MAG TPA: amidohydrolase family protein [Puia sp.]|jgi:imidazolonepropionase-like amidohydrolase
MNHLRITTALLLTFCLLTISVSAQTDKTTTDLALVGARIYPSPSAAPIENGTVLVRNGKITAVGSSDKIAVPKSFRIISCKGMVLTAAFWNCHVHFIEPKWNRADTMTAERFDRQMTDMLTSHGFAHVFDIAELDIRQTLRIRDRIRKGDVTGPVIYTAGVPLVPPNGSPFYIAPMKLPEATDPQQAVLHVRQQIDSGADGIKLWTGSPTTHGIVHMPVPVVRAIVKEAHRLGKPVFAHPTDNQGLAIALDGGLDILAHTTPDGGRIWTADTIRRMLAAHLSVIPTLKLWKDELAKNGIKDEAHNPFIPVAQKQVHDFAVAGGTLLFGTDVGYITDYSTRDEYNLLAGAGLDFRYILKMLTTAPAKQFGLAARTGQIAAGMDADIVLLDGDPATDILSFDKVIYTLCQGKFIYQPLTGKICILYPPGAPK